LCGVISRDETRENEIPVSPLSFLLHEALSCLHGLFKFPPLTDFLAAGNSCAKLHIATYAGDVERLNAERSPATLNIADFKTSSTFKITPQTYCEFLERAGGKGGWQN